MAGTIYNPYDPRPGGWFQTPGAPNPSAPVIAPSTTPAPATPAAPAAAARPRYRFTQSGGVFQVPEGMSDEDAAELVRRWDAKVAETEKAANESNGFARMVKLRELEDVKAGRDNALAIARLQANTSRYGTDVQARTQMADLQERQRQFDATHGLDVQRLGLERAKTATDYLSTPDRYVQAGDFLNLSGQVMSGAPGYSGYSGGRAQPKTMGDFAVLQSGGNPGRQIGGGGGAGGGAGTDPRVKAVSDLMKAQPPSDGIGHDANDYAVLNAARAIYGMNLTPQQQATVRSSPQYQKILASAGRRLGEDPEEWQYQQQRSLPGQGSVRAA